MAWVGRRGGGEITSILVIICCPKASSGRIYTRSPPEALTVAAHGGQIATHIAQAIQTLRFSSVERGNTHFRLSDAEMLHVEVLNARANQISRILDFCAVQHNNV